MAKKADGWHARWGGKLTGVSTNPGYFPNPYGATATSLPLLGHPPVVPLAPSGTLDRVGR